MESPGLTSIGGIKLENKHGCGHINTSLPSKHLYNICTMLDQRRRRWADVVQMLYKCFVFAGLSLVLLNYLFTFFCWNC